jgi:hypothetical protein
MNQKMRIGIFVPAILLACTLMGCIENIAAHEMESICFQHTGPEDKPLPSICVMQHSTGSPSLSPENYRINVVTSEIEAIKKLARSLDTPRCLGEYGSYATIAQPKIIICKKDMKTFLHTVKQFADSPTSRLIDELLLRI